MYIKGGFMNLKTSKTLYAKAKNEALFTIRNYNNR
jgi:hypothetical protein